MKKIAFLILFLGIVLKLKAQQNSTTQNLKQLTTPNLHTSLDTIPPSNFFFKPKDNDPKALFYPKPKVRSAFPNTNNLVASLDRMPIVTSKGNWNMPVVKPDGTVVYSTPIKRLPPIVKPRLDSLKSNP